LSKIIGASVPRRLSGVAAGGSAARGEHNEKVMAATAL